MLDSPDNVDLTDSKVNPADVVRLAPSDDPVTTDAPAPSDPKDLKEPWDPLVSPV